MKVKRVRLPGVLTALALVLAAGCEESGLPPEGGIDELRLEEDRVLLRTGESIQLVATDEAGRDVSSEAAWTVEDEATATVDAGLLTATRPGMTRVFVRYRGLEDAARVVVPFDGSLAEGMAVSAPFGGDEPLSLTGGGIVRDRLGSDADPFFMSAVEGVFDPDDPPGFDLGGDGSRLHMALSSSPVEGAFTFESWEVTERPGDGFALRGPDGVAVWRPDPGDPDRVELWISVGTFDVEFDVVDRPALAGMPNGLLVGRVAFDAAGLEVDLSAGPPRIVDQLDDVTHRVFAEFQVALRVFPVGSGTVGVQGGPAAFETVDFVAPLAGGYRDGMILTQGIGVPADGELALVKHDVWIGSPAEGRHDIGSVAPDAIRGTDAYRPGRIWSWLGFGSDPQAVVRGDGEVNGFSSGGTLTVDRYVPASDDVFGRIEGSFEIPQTVHVEGEGTTSHVVAGTFVAPVLPHRLAAQQIIPPPELGDSDARRSNPAFVTIGDGRSRIVGRVVEFELRGIGGVPVSISGPAGSGTAISNDFGTFTFEGLTPGDYTVTWEVPDGHQLADGETTISPITIGEREQKELDLNLSDAEGNGLIRVLAVEDGTSRPLDGVTFEVRLRGTEDVVTTIVSGSDRPGMGVAPLEPGTYVLTAEDPDGFALDPTSELTATVTKGGHWLVVARFDPS